MASELLEQLFGKQLQDCSWSYANPEYTYENEVEVIVQVNGKLRAAIKAVRGTEQSVIEPLARTTISNWLEGKEIIKVIFVKDRMINFVIR